MSKLSRHQAIRELVASGEYWSQEELRQALEKRAIAATQATLSRDIYEMGLVKGQHGYTLPNVEVLDQEGPTVNQSIRTFALGVKQAQNLLVLRTIAGSAQPVAAAIDSDEWPEVVGTVGGDDTVLVICPDTIEAGRVLRKLQELMA
jgi:transcriptional regulator of arginine metabolism